jgi:quinol-cytochrome oxidoreductase complex cytochrome b subunit
MRGVHRYASDAAVVAVAFHALRMFVQGRSWGPRTLAWVSGLILLFVTFVCGWTGFVMVWDVQGQVLAQAGARLLDVVPIFSEPISRAFTGERALPGAFSSSTCSPTSRCRLDSGSCSGFMYRASRDRPSCRRDD